MHVLDARVQENVWDVLIIGAGPVGLYAGYYAGFRGLSAVLVDSVEQVGGQISAMYPEKYLYDIAGFPAVKGRDLVAGLSEQLSQFDHPIVLGQQAVSLEGEAGGFTVTTHLGVVIKAKTVLVTGGIGTFNPRPPDVGVDYVGRGLSYFVADPHTLADKQVVVVGGGDSAVDWALLLEKIAADVTLVHRREQFRAHAHSVRLLEESSVTVLTKARVLAVAGDSTVRSVLVSSPEGEVELEADHVVSALGFIADLGPILDWKLDMRDRFVHVGQTMETSRPGVYAAGDLSDYDGKVRLIAVGFGEAATAINNLAVRLHPEESLRPAHSSDLGPQGV